jgi:hypothetical protein
MAGPGETLVSPWPPLAVRLWILFSRILFRPTDVAPNLPFLFPSQISSRRRLVRLPAAPHRANLVLDSGAGDCSISELNNRDWFLNSYQVDSTSRRSSSDAKSTDSRQLEF